MTVTELIKQKKLTKYRLAKDSGIPYTTVSEICSGKTQLSKCSAETVFRLAKELGVSMESLLEPGLLPRISFELYKSSVCHQVKELGDISFITRTLESDTIREYYQRGWYPESLYLLAMLDYLSRENDVPLCTRYDDLRQRKLSDVIFPAGILAASAAAKSDRAKKQAIKDAIPEFMRFNIVESEVRDVI